MPSGEFDLKKCINRKGETYIYILQSGKLKVFMKIILINTVQNETKPF